MTSYPADCRNIIVFPGLSPATLRRYERAGILAAVKLNSRLPDAALERLFAGSDLELTAAECLRLGLVDEVFTPRALKIRTPTPKPQVESHGQNGSG